MSFQDLCSSVFWQLLLSSCKDVYCCYVVSHSPVKISALHKTKNRKVDLAPHGSNEKLISTLLIAAKKTNLTSNGARVGAMEASLQYHHVAHSVGKRSGSCSFKQAPKPELVHQNYFSDTKMLRIFAWKAFTTTKKSSICIQKMCKSWKSCIWPVAELGVHQAWYFASGQSFS